MSQGRLGWGMCPCTLFKCYFFALVVFNPRLLLELPAGALNLPTFAPFNGFLWRLNIENLKICPDLSEILSHR